MDVQLVSAANNKFALDLFKILYDGNQNQNTFVSPFSISVALAMTHLGAREETAQGMAKALRWETDDETKLHDQFQAYVTQLQTPNDQYQLSTANRIYIEKSYAVLDEFKNKTKKCYLAEAVSSNFVSDADNERLQINNWVSEQTKNKINDLLAPGVLDALTRMVLVNAIYFKGNWDKQFEVENTKPKPFKVAPGQTKDVPMMTMTHNFPYVQDEELKCTALEIPYKGRELGMVIILPDEDFGLQTLVNSLTSEKLDDLLSQVRGPRGKVNFSFPKFEVTSSFQLKDPLSKLGMANAFDGLKANFSGISGVNDLVISAVVHKAFIKVNEEGTEAAAATAVTMMLCSMPMPPPVVTSSFKLNDPLSKLGMAHAFDDSKANFSGISGVNDLFLSAVVHKAFVKVNEEGTEAAAATAAVMMMRSMPMPPHVVTVDHPFLFVIRDNRANGNLLFLGQISDPSS